PRRHLGGGRGGRQHEPRRRRRRRDPGHRRPAARHPRGGPRGLLAGAAPAPWIPRPPAAAGAAELARRGARVPPPGRRAPLPRDPAGRDPGTRNTERRNPFMYRLTTILAPLARRAHRARGQGTVEYVGIVLAVGALLLALAGPLHGQAGAVARKISTGI